MARHLCQSATKLIKSASGSAGGGAARLMKCSQSQRCEVNRNPWTERIAAQQGSSCLSGREESSGPTLVPEVRSSAKRGPRVFKGRRQFRFESALNSKKKVVKCFKTITDQSFSCNGLEIL